MKKIFSIFTAALMSASMFAALTPAPDDDALNAYAEAGQNLVYAIYVEDSIKCNDIVLVGTYNGWTGAAESCSTFVAVEGFAGWYVCCVKDESEDIQAKPAQLDGAGTFNWDYQVGKLEQEAVVRGTATIVPGYSNECDIKAISDAAPLLINVSSWKTNPCTAVFHDYIITFISPDCNAEEYITPAISGGFNSWAQEAMTQDLAATYDRQQAGQFGAVFKDTVRAAEGTQYKFRSSEDWGAEWTNELREYVDSIEDWAAFNGGANFTFGTVTEIEYDLGDPTKYSWTSCERPFVGDTAVFDITVIIPAFCDSVPAAIYADSIMMVGDFNGWADSSAVYMTKVKGNEYIARGVKAVQNSTFKVKAGLGWNVEIMKSAEASMDNLNFPKQDSVATYDLSKYFWKGCPAPSAISVIKAEAPVAKKMIVNGQMMIIVEGAKYNVLGAEMK